MEQEEVDHHKLQQETTKLSQRTNTKVMEKDLLSGFIQADLDLLMDKLSNKETITTIVPRHKAKGHLLSPVL